MEASVRRFNRAKAELWLIPSAIFLIALTVRLIGLKFSFPLLTHHDEQDIINPLIAMSRNHTLDSGHYNRPNQVLYTILFGYLNALSKLFFHKNFGWAYAENPLFFYYHARLVVAILGAFIPAIAWKIGKLIKGVDFSVPAAILTCFYPPFIIHSHYITGDILNTLLSLLIILFCLLYLQKQKKAWLILACVGVALNTLEKYPGILSYGIILVTLGISAFQPKPINWRGFFRAVLITLAIVIVSMFLFAPHLFLKLDQVRDVLTVEARTTHLGADGFTWAGNMLFYLRVFLDAGGWIVTGFAAAGIVLAIIARQPEMLLLFFGAGYWFALSKLGLHWERWSLPMMITPLLLAALGTARTWTALKQRKAVRRLTAACFIIFSLVYALNGLSASVIMTWQDTRVDALQFLTDNDITEEITTSEGYTPFLPRNVRTIFDFDYSNPGQTRYVVLSSNMYGRYNAEPERYAAEIDYYAGLRANASLIAEFAAEEKPEGIKEQLIVLGDYLTGLTHQTKTTHTTGPTIQIYQLP